MQQSRRGPRRHVPSPVSGGWTTKRNLPRDTVDAVIVGGGAAGIAAAAYLLARQRSVLVIEALCTLGGRARTVMVEGMALDLGCGWLHSADRNPLAGLAESQGLALNREPSAWGDTT
jgi:monoamine oxidase